MKLVQMPLGEDGIKFVQSRLDDAAKGLANELLRLPIYAGSAYALIPEGTTLERMKEFETGGLVSESDRHKWFAEHILKLNARHAHGILVFQDAWGASPTDQNLARYQSPIFYDSTDVYYAVPHSKISQSSILQAVKDIRGFRELGAFTIATNDFIGRKITESELKSLAENAQEIYVDAYDGESFVIWVKGK